MFVNATCGGMMHDATAGVMEVARRAKVWREKNRQRKEEDFCGWRRHHLSFRLFIFQEVGLDVQLTD